MNLLDQNLNNLHQFQSDLVFTGVKKFEVDANDKDQYVLVVSSVLRKKFIDMEILDSSEVYKCLK